MKKLMIIRVISKYLLTLKLFPKEFLNFVKKVFESVVCFLNEYSTLILVIVTAFYVFYTYNISVNTKEQVNIANQNMKNMQRAYLYVDFLKYDLSNPKIELIYENIGLTEAYTKFTYSDVNFKDQTKFNARKYVFKNYKNLYNRQEIRSSDLGQTFFPKHKEKMVILGDKLDINLIKAIKIVQFCYFHYYEIYMDIFGEYHDFYGVYALTLDSDSLVLREETIPPFITTKSLNKEELRPLMLHLKIDEEVFNQ